MNGCFPLAFMFSKEKRALSDRSLPYPTKHRCSAFCRSPMPFPDGREMKFFAVLWTLRYAIAALDVLADGTGLAIKNKNFRRTGLFDKLYKSRTFMCGFAVLKCNGLKKIGDAGILHTSMRYNDKLGNIPCHCFGSGICR